MDLSFLTSEQLAGLQFLAGELSVEDYAVQFLTIHANNGIDRLKAASQPESSKLQELSLEDLAQVKTLVDLLLNPETKEAATSKLSEATGISKLEIIK